MQTASESLDRFMREVRTELLLTAWHLGLYAPPDRKVLDETILPFYAARPGFERMLFVGVKAYNAKNRRLFRGRSYSTIDPNPAFARFGGTPHVVDGLENIAKHFAPSSFDVIVINGVIGHGLNDLALVDRAIGGCHTALRAGGELIVGVNEETRSAVRLSAIPAMDRFEPAPLPPLCTSRHVVRTPLRERSHTFLFYRRLDDAL